MGEENKITAESFLSMTKNLFKFLLTKWNTIILVGIIGAVFGLAYSFMQKPIYTAELVFASETDNGGKLGSYAGLAAQFGFDLNTGGSAFEGENIIELFKSNNLIDKTLYTTVTINNEPTLLINYYVKFNKLQERWKNNPHVGFVNFTNDRTENRLKDSLTNIIIADICKSNLTVEKIDKKLSFINVKMQSNDELFSKVFAEQITNNVIQFYIEYKSKKNLSNVELLQHQVDSVKGLLDNSISDVASSTDLNVNPIRQYARVGTQQKQIGLTVNGTLYTELLKNLELAKISYQKETPFIQIIDAPRLPLTKKKLGKLMGIIIFGFLAGFLSTMYFTIKKLW